MESFELYSAVRGYHVYRDVWEPSVGEKLVARREFNNDFDKFAVKVLNGWQVGQLHSPNLFAKLLYILAIPVSPR